MFIDLRQRWWGQREGEREKERNFIVREKH